MPRPSATSSSKLTTTKVYLKKLVPTCALLLSCSLAFSSRSNSFAQQPAPVDDVVRVNTQLHVFPIRVRNKHGQAVPGLTLNDLTLKDEDSAVTGLYFYPGADRISLVFALDQSGSVAQLMRQQHEAAKALFERFGNQSQVAVIRFATQPHLVTPFGGDFDLTRSENFLSDEPNQRTAIFDAAANAALLFKTLPRLRSERRLVILISDGLDNASTLTPKAAIKAALENQVTFYVIHLPLFTPRDGRLQVRTPSKGFRELAEKTGGKYFLAGNPTAALTARDIDLAPVFKAIEDDLKSQYLLGFYTRESRNDGQMHRVVIGLPLGVEYRIADFGYAQKHELLIGAESSNKQ